jgi:predicted dehydrogenase
MAKSPVNRRDFLKTTAAGGAALALSAASASRVFGANERVGVAFIGTGGRCQAHISVVNSLSKEKGNVAPVAVCDLWDGHEGEYETKRNGKTVKHKYAQGLYPSAKKCGLREDDKEHVTKDYRRILDLKDVDVVLIATPDHWHAKISMDAARAGKDVYCEKPMTKTMVEAQAVVDVMQQEKRVMSVGVQSMADARWRMANEMIRRGDIGHVCQAQTSYYRNSSMGQWRYYPLFKDMNPKTVDWTMFLGHDFSIEPSQPPLGPKVPFDRAIFGQWRCYWPFGGGMFTDLFVHQTTHMLAAMGVRYPARVVGSAGLYLEYDGRDVPDVSAVVAEFDEGCQYMVTATMIASYPIEEVIRGHLGTIKFMKDGFEVIQDSPAGSPGIPARLEETVKGDYHDANPPRGTDADTKALWENFLECVRTRNRETLSTPELGAAAFTTVAMGVESYRRGVVLFWDKEQRRAVPADSTWARRWERVSKQRGKPKQIIGWEGDDKGSLLEPEEYQKLGGPWTDGKDPAEGIAGG